MKCTKCGSDLNERGKDFDIDLTPEQEKELQRNILPTETLQEFYLNIKCLKCHTKLSLMDLVENIEDDVVVCKTAEDINKHMPELNKATFKRR